MQYFSSDFSIFRPKMGSGPMGRLFFLLTLALRHVWHRLRHGWAEEMVVFLCSLVLVGLFYYIFHDFLEAKLAVLSPALRTVLARIVSVAILIIASFQAARLVRAENQKHGAFTPFLNRVGEDAIVVRRFLWARNATILVVTFFVAWWLAQNMRPQWSLEVAVAWQVLMLALTAALSRQRFSVGRERILRGPSPLKPGQTNRTVSMIRWRLVQIMSRHPLCRIAFGLAALTLAGSGIAAAQQAPLPTLFPLALLGGIFTAIPLHLQLAEDLRHSWAEKAAGVTHASIMRIYSILGVAFGLAVAIAYLLVLAFAGGAELVHEAWFVPIVAALSPTLMPAFMFQIDGRRPALQIMILFMVSLFLGTACYAHPLALLLAPLLFHMAAQYQNNRYYRA